MQQEEPEESTPVKAKRNSRPGQSLAKDHFADRLLAACDANPNVPPLGGGRLVWVRDEFMKRYNESLSTEGIRRWFAGVTAPRHKTLVKLAEILGVDDAWFAFGTNSILTEKEKKVRSRTASGAVNVIAGLIQLAGGNPAFVDEDNRIGTKMQADLIAVIRGGSYFIHVSNGILVDGEWSFAVPVDAADCVLLGVIFEGGLKVRVYELDVRLLSGRSGGTYQGVLSKFAKRELTGFEERL